jgi:hypothetical protein
MEIIKQGFLSYSSKKVFVIFLIERESPYLEGRSDYNIHETKA